MAAVRAFARSFLFTTALPPATADDALSANTAWTRGPLRNRGIP